MTASDIASITRHLTHLKAMREFLVTVRDSLPVGRQRSRLGDALDDQEFMIKNLTAAVQS